MDNQSNLVAEAVRQFRAERPDAAKKLFEQAVAAGASDPQTLLLFAISAEQVGDFETSLATLDRLLESEPRVVRAWLMKGDIEAANRRRDVARAAYERALAEAKNQPDPNPELGRRLEAARRWIKDSDHAEKLRKELASAGVEGTTGSQRFQNSLDIILDGEPLYLQRPNVYFFPGLAAKPFFERECFEWVEQVESRTDAIAAELDQLLKDRNLFRPHVPGDGQTPEDRYGGMAGNAGWSSLQLWTAGAPVEENASRCPETMAALEAVPLPHFSKRNPSAPAVMFSMLKAGARIPPHTGSTNVRLICHLPLIVPPDCALRVGAETREWERGKLLIFDDTIEHEAWNRSEEERVVLIFDIWRPELSESERAAVQTLFRCLETVRA